MDAAALASDLVTWRRAIHQHPELGFAEVETAKLIASLLTSWGVPVSTGIAGTGLVALIEGDQPGKTLLIRADMDALPVKEATGASYSSQVDGVMHACGHDGHVAILLGLARLLWPRRHTLKGSLKLVFQPAEEGPGGAEPMIRSGVLEHPRVDAAVGFHLWNSLPMGQIGTRSGPIMAATDQFEITVTGRGGHGAKPHLSVDAIVVAAHVITALQGIVSRMVDPLEPAVVTIGTINGGFRHNIIAPEVQLTGTVRTYDRKLHDTLPGLIERVVKGVCDAMGASYELRYEPVYPATENDPAMTDLVRRAASSVIGPENTHVCNPSMGGEDMSYFLRAVPGCYFFLGSANAERGLDQPHHSPGFDFDESALVVGLRVLEQVVQEFFSR